MIVVVLQMMQCCCRCKDEDKRQVSEEPDVLIQGNPRNKVALKPGRSLMDWIRLTHSGEDLTGVRGILQTITLQQLAEHNTESDCWLAIRGTVFNVTRYMEFHPGGHDQLMRGAGKDATVLFDEIHAYVNYSSLLKKCIVGHMSVPDNSHTNLESAVTSNTVLSTNPEPVFKSPAEPLVTVLLPLDWYQTDDTMHIVFYTKIPGPLVRVELLDREVSVLLTLKSRHIQSRLTLLEDVKWPCEISVSDIGKVDIQFVKVARRHWSSCGSPCHGTLVESGSDKTIRTLIVKERYRVTHDTDLIVLRHESQCYEVIPVGFHIQLHVNVDGEDVVRSYTPVPDCLAPATHTAGWAPDCVCLMVKRYADGAVSPRLHELSKGDGVQASGPQGTFSVISLKYRASLFMIAAGTGITPMLGVIRWALQESRKQCKSVRLLFFNRTSKDILWQIQLEDLSKLDERFRVQNVLSEPEGDWQGLTGRINKSVLASFLPDVDLQSDQDFALVCGPPLFTQITKELLVELGFSSNQFHCFVG